MPSSLRPLFGPAAEQDRDALYSKAQVQQALLDYREQPHLAASDGGIKLDRCLVPDHRYHRNVFFPIHQRPPPTCALFLVGIFPYGSEYTHKQQVPGGFRGQNQAGQMSNYPPSHSVEFPLSNASHLPHTVAAFSFVCKNAVEQAIPFLLVS